MDASDLILVGGEGFHRRHGLLAQHLGPVDGRAGVRRHGRVFPFDFRHRPAELGLPPLAVRLRPLYRLLMPVDTLPAQSQQLTRPLDGLQRALLQALHGLAQRPPVLIEFPFAFIDLPLALVQRGLPPVSLPFPLVSPALPLVAICGLAIALLLATMADRVVRGALAYKTLLIWPYAVAPAVAGVLWAFLFAPSIGIATYALKRAGIDWNWIIQGDQAMLLVVIAAVWKQISYNFLFFLAGLQSIPRSLIEAAAIDGAG